MDLEEIIERYKVDPYENFPMLTPHTGQVGFLVREGAEAAGPSGPWRERPGSYLYSLLRQGNPKKVSAPTNGTVADLRTALEGEFVAAGTWLMTIKHPMTRQEVVQRVLQEVLYMFRAPEKAKYFFVPDLAAKMEKDKGKVLVRHGEEILTMSRMKRDAPVIYDGQSGIIYASYISPNRSMSAGEPLLGICPPERLDYVRRLIQRINLEWETPK
ncbi:MAG: hypothetical protein V2A77_00445 [Pseudomonadota bacterium]